MVNARPRAAAWLAGFGGLMAVLLVAAAGWVVGDLLYASPETDERGQVALTRKQRASLRPAGTVAATADIVSLRRLRSIAADQLREADRVLAACPPPARVSRSSRAVAAWNACAGRQVGHLDVSGRLNASIFYATAQRLPFGRCRRMALGRSNAMALLADAAHHLRAGAADRARAGRRAPAHRLADLPRLLRYTRKGLRRSAPGCRTLSPAHD